ncbi:hypothetical protein JST56_02390 [Candidatus Dependentiae bacterium]|nr:hypothetical protein [Candidatus Dependentiae bacterium]
MKRFIARVFLLLGCFTPLYGISSELCEQAWFICPWEKIEQEYKENQNMLNISVYDIPEYKNNLPEWITDAWVNELVTYSKKSINIKGISLLQESDGINSILSTQGLDDSFKQAFNAYSKAHAGVNQLEPFDIFLSCFSTKSDVNFFTCTFVSTSQRHQIKTKPNNVYLLHNKPLIASQESSTNIYGSILFGSLAYGLLLAIAYLGEGPGA